VSQATGGNYGLVGGVVCGSLMDAGWGAGVGAPGLILDLDGPSVEVQVFESRLRLSAIGSCQESLDWVLRRPLTARWGRWSCQLQRDDAVHLEHQSVGQRVLATLWPAGFSSSDQVIGPANDHERHSDRSQKSPDRDATLDERR
jgi:hypothetical protein